jgi:hypothetical protein
LSYRHTKGYLEFNVADKTQEILFNNIVVNKKREEGKTRYITNGSGEVVENDKFILDKKTSFKGTVRMSADSKNLQFDGFAKLNTKVIPASSWFSIKSPIDRKNVEIAYAVPRNPENEKLYVGVFLNRDSLHLYPSIMGPKLRIIDRDIFRMEGFVHYNDKFDEMVFRDSTAKVSDGSKGNQMIVSDIDGKIKE